MVEYRVEVHSTTSITLENIYIKLVGTVCSSERQVLHTCSLIGVPKTTVNCPENVGTLLLVELEAKSSGYDFILKEWFCSKLVVTTPEGEKVSFPCYQWLDDKKPSVCLRNDKALLINREMEPVLLQQRRQELRRRQQDFRWKKYAHGLPYIIDAATATDLPNEVRFSFTKDMDMKYNSFTVLAEMALETLLHRSDSWCSLEDLQGCLKKPKPNAYVVEHWKDDDFFGYQFLNGLNPMLIQRCSKLPENFPVTDDMVRSSLGGSSLSEEMQKGNIFLCDYKSLSGFAGNVINNRQQFLAAPLCLLFSSPEEKLMPIAIQLLKPHTLYTFQINILARNLLISKDGIFEKFTAIGSNYAAKTFLPMSVSSMTYSSLCILDNIKERGLENIPNYYYRDDGLKLWNLIFKFVKGVLTHFYQSNDDVKNDSELQNWIKDIYQYGFLENSNSGIPQSFSTVEELVQFVTMVIFTVSAQHAATNNGQFEFGGWMPNLPSSLRCPPPKKKGEATEKTILEALPDVTTTIHGLAVLYLLSKKSTDHYPLGHYTEELFGDEEPGWIIAEFHKDLCKLDEEIEERNKSLPLPYAFLKPINVDNSVAL